MRRLAGVGGQSRDILQVDPAGKGVSYLLQYLPTLPSPSRARSQNIPISSVDWRIKRFRVI